MTSRLALVASTVFLLCAGVACHAQALLRDGFEAAFEMDFVRAGGSGATSAGSDIALAWLATAAQECQATSSGPAATTFSGLRPTARAAEVVRLAKAGDYVFTLRCTLGAREVVQTVAVTATAAPAGAPQLSLSFFDTAEWNVGDHRTLSYSIGSAQACNATEAVPQATGWRGMNAFGATSRSITLWRPGLHAFTLACSNAAGSAQVTRMREIAARAGCDVPGVMPLGWQYEQRTWSSTIVAFDGSPISSWPGSVAYPVPLRIKVGAIRSIRIDTFAGTAPRLMFFWQAPAANPQDFYHEPRPAAGMFFALSPCPGDVRPPVAGVPQDPFLAPACRAFAEAGVLSQALAQDLADHCRLQPGRTYFLTQLAADPRDGLAPGETSCAVPDLGSCDVDVRQFSLQ